MPSLSGGESYSLARMRSQARLEEPRFGDQPFDERRIDQLAKLDIILGDWQKACERGGG